MAKLWNTNYIKVMTTNFLLYFAFYLLTPLLPLYLSDTFGATKDTIGIVLSGYTVAALIIRPFCGYVVDSFSRKTVLMICLSAFAIFFAGYIAASTILMFAICRTLHGAPFGAVTVANSTCAIDVLPAERRNEGIGLYGLSNNFAMAIAPTIGIYLHNLTIGLFASRLQGRKALSKGLITHNAAEGMLISLVGFTIFVAIPHPVAYYLSALLIGLGNGHLYPAFLNMFIQVARHDQRGTANSSILTGWDLGFGIGCLLGGIVSEHFGYTATFWIVAIENALSVLLFFLASRQFFESRKRTI